MKRTKSNKISTTLEIAWGLLTCDVVYEVGRISVSIEECWVKGFKYAVYETSATRLHDEKHVSFDLMKPLVFELPEFTM